jgi:drug/metabolite transporter (DMT)-like permease
MKNTQQPHFKDYLHLHFLVLIWGFTAILGLLVKNILPIALTFYRTLWAALGLALVLVLTKKMKKLDTKEILKLLLVGCSMGVHWFAFFASARASNASVCLAGMATTSLFTALLAPLFSNKKISLLEVSLGLLVIVGLYVIFRFEIDRAVGLAWALFSAFLAALFTIANSRFAQKHDPMLITFYEMVGGCVSSGLLWIGYVLVFPETPNHLPNVKEWGWILILAWVCTVYAYSAGVGLLRKISPFTFNLTVNLEPVYGIVLAFLIFGESEKMTLGFYIGTVIILAAVVCYPVFKRD